MKVLLERGCRVWYCTGPAGSTNELLHRQARSAGAAWTLLYLTDALTADKESKSRVMANQKMGKPISCLDPDGANRYLAMDIREDTPKIPLYRCRTGGQLDAALIRSAGYTQELLGKPVTVKNPWLGKLTGLLLLLTVLLAGCCLLHFRQGPVYEDTVAFSDPVLREAVRTAAGGGALTPDSLQEIRCLHLTALPESWSDLSLLPGLQKIEIPQDAAAQAADLPVDTYRIVLYGGAS